MAWVTKDSGSRVQYDSGMQRDTEDDKPRFDLLWPDDVPYEAQLLTRCAALMARGAVKYGDRNWERAHSRDEWDRMRSSAMRHLMQWMALESDEDHAAAVVFNLLAAETIRRRWDASCPRHGSVSPSSQSAALSVSPSSPAAGSQPSPPSCADTATSPPSSSPCAACSVGAGTTS